MVPSRLIIVSLYPILILTSHAIINAQEPLLYSCLNEGNYTTNSTYKTNLNTLLSSLPSKININYAFYSSSNGQNPNKAYATGLCRGDVDTSVCRSCLTNSTNLLTQRCPYQKGAVGWDDECTLRYSSRPLQGIKKTDPAFAIWDTRNVSSDIDGFNDGLEALLEDLRSRAVEGGSLRKFAAGNADAPNNFETIYGIAQCSPDLSDVDCSDCLVDAIDRLTACCKGKRAARLAMPSCTVAYDLDRFYDVSTELPPPSSFPPPPPIISTPPSTTNGTSGNNGKKSNTSRTVISVVASIVVFTVVLTVLLIIFISIYFNTRKEKESVESAEEINDESAESLQFEFETIRAATNSFADANKIGQGGFGAVYRGRLSNGRDIAVKRLSKYSGQGDVEFKNEIILVARLQHRNLVNLLDPTKQAHLDWNRRYKIIEGIARGLLYLHEDSRLKIIHRDLKASNILLDATMEPKISDFGMAKLFAIDQSQADTTRIVGTYGYMPPEYAMRGQFSMKSDVFSFGVLVLEIVSGQSISGFSKENNAESLLSHAWKKWREGRATDIMDPKMTAEGSIVEIMRCIHIGLLCVQENVGDRPTMASVGLMLRSYSVSLRVPSRPAYFTDGATGSSVPNMFPRKSRLTNVLFFGYGTTPFEISIDMPRLVPHVKLSNGQDIAVKRLSKNSGQGDIEFKNEILLLARQQHRSFCLEKSERLLIYEFVPNSSLDHLVFEGIARGLLYLREDSRLKIIHRDLKANHILLDAKMNPKISDFGMAKLFAVDQTQGDTT
ncbi:hypothetical protein FNV43_RR06542 [Rhamnella rubrinervis]|uniref:non-specific serine/threonine protein kinase n=1 Tax=Rhamnella rubrinervis TaxID=2594499 RepID=A0A8K0HE11_9ROSA|nr:hypothetical protein FNV43_RR06542 [Rhamnella rubrinervis]